jgi:hypothetical protein
MQESAEKCINNFNILLLDTYFLDFQIEKYKYNISVHILKYSTVLRKGDLYNVSS